METMMMDIDTVHTTSIPHRPTKRTFKELQNEESSSESFPFLALPTELQYEVMTSVENPLDVLSISRACKQTNSLSKRESVWRNLCLSKWNDLKEKPSNWKRYFYERNTFLSSQAALMDWQDKSALPNPSNLPQPRQSFTGTCVNGKIIYIGGQTSVRVRFDDIYVFDPASRTFSKPNVRGNPPKFARHSAVAIGDKIYIFGGYDGFGSFFGLAVLDTINWSWEYPRVSGNAPIPRTNHAVTAIGSRMYMFGGNDTTSPEKDKLRCGTYDDFVYFETETSTWHKPITKGKSPCGRSGHHMVTIGGKIYLFGGGLWNDATKSWLERYNDMYQYDPVTNEWTELAVQNSPNFAFISLPHWTVGYFIFVYNDPVWCFDTITRTWHSLNTKGKKPQKRFLGPASYVQNFNTVFMFGGVYAEVINDFDMLSWPPSISLILQSESSDPESNI